MHPMKKIPLALLLITLFTLSSPAAAEDAAFTDVSDGIWYAQAVSYCHQKGWMSGTSDTAFSPALPMSRAMLATVLYRAEGSPAVAWQDSFNDVTPGLWYSEAVLWAQQQALVNGYGDGRFGPYDALTREQIIAVLWRYSDSPAPQDGGDAFADGDSISLYAQDAVKWAKQNQIISGRPGNLFDPRSSATRAETAVILMNLMEQAPAAPDPLPDPVPEPDPEPTPEVPINPGDIPPLLPNTYDKNSFYVQNGFLHYAGGTPSHVGIDVSSYQGVIDWERVAASGVEFAIIRAGYRGYTNGSFFQDETFIRNIEGALDAGLEVGAYIFSQAVTPQEGIEEAYQLLDWVRDYPITYPLIFDWERVERSTSRTSTTPGSVVTAAALAFCRTIEEAGYIPMSYANTSNVFDEVDISVLTEYPFWLAHYTTDWTPTGFQYHHHMWQYSSKGRVDGIEGNVDLDICFVDWDQWTRGMETPFIPYFPEYPPSK